MGHVGIAGPQPIVLDTARLQRVELLYERIVNVATAAEDANIAKHAGIVIRGGDGMAGAHRQAGDGPVVLLGHDTVIALDERNDLFHQALRVRPFVRLRSSAARRRTAGCPSGTGSSRSTGTSACRCLSGWQRRGYRRQRGCGSEAIT